MKKSAIILLVAMFLITSDSSEAGIGPGIGIFNSAVHGVAAFTNGTLATWSDGTQSTWSDGTNAQWSGS